MYRPTKASYQQIWDWEVNKKAVSNRTHSWKIWKEWNFEFPWEFSRTEERNMPKVYDVQQRDCLHFPHQNFDRKLHPSLHKIMKGCVNWTLSCQKINKFLPFFVYFWTRECPIHKTFHYSMHIWVKFSYKVLRGKM